RNGICGMSARPIRDEAMVLLLLGLLGSRLSAVEPCSPSRCESPTACQLRRIGYLLERICSHFHQNLACNEHCIRSESRWPAQIPRCLLGTLDSSRWDWSTVARSAVATGCVR